MQWDDLKIALALDEHGTSAGAARALGVTSSTINRRLAALQEALGVRLFERLRGGVQPTEAGQRLLEHARAIERQAARLELSVLGGDQKLSGVVCLTLPFSIQELIEDALVRFSQAHPEVELIVRCDEHHADLSQREADVAIRLTAEPPPVLIGRRLCRVPFGVYGSRQYLEQAPSPHHLIGEDDGQHPPWWSQGGVVVMRSNHLSWALRAARRDLGLARLPCFVGDACPELLRVGPLIPTGGFGVWVLTHEQLRHTARVRRLVSALTDALLLHQDRFEGRISAP